MTEIDSVSYSSEFDVVVIFNEHDGKASPFLTINTDLSHFIPRPPSTATSLSVNPPGDSFSPPSSHLTINQRSTSSALSCNDVETEQPSLNVNPLCVIDITNKTDDADKLDSDAHKLDSDAHKLDSDAHKLDSTDDISTVDDSIFVKSKDAGPKAKKTHTKGGKKGGQFKKKKGRAPIVPFIILGGILLIVLI